MSMMTETETTRAQRPAIKRPRWPDVVVGLLAAAVVAVLLAWSLNQPDDPRQARLDELSELFTERYGVEVSATYYDEPTGEHVSVGRGAAAKKTRYVEVWTVDGVAHDGTCKAVDTAGENNRLICDGQEITGDR